MLNKSLHTQAIIQIALQSVDSYSIHWKGKQLHSAVQQDIVQVLC